MKRILMVGFALVLMSLVGCAGVSYNVHEITKEEIGSAKNEIASSTYFKQSDTKRLDYQRRALSQLGISESFDPPQYLPEPSFEIVSYDVFQRLQVPAEELCQLTKRVNGCSWRLELLDEADINAYATHGENGEDQVIAVTRGVYDFSEDEDQFAFVIAHEYAHHLGDHIDKSAQNGMVSGLSTAAILLAGAYASGGYMTPEQANQYGQDSAVITEGMMRAGQLVFSAEMEEEADYLAAFLIRRAGYDVEEARRLILRMSAMHGNVGDTGAFSSHPAGPERLVRVDKAIGEVLESMDLIPPHLKPEEAAPTEGE